MRLEGVAASSLTLRVSFTLGGACGLPTRFPTGLRTQASPPRASPLVARIALDRLIRILGGYAADLRQQGQEDAEEERIEVLAAALFHDLDGLLFRHGRVVNAAMGEGVVNVGQGYDAGRLGYGQAGEAVGIAAAVPALVMTEGNLVGHLQHRRRRAFQHAGAQGRVRFHDLEFFVREPAGLLQDGVGNADLADVVHGGGHADVADLDRRPAEDFGEELAIEAGALDVRAGLFVAITRCAEQAQDRLFVGAADGLHLVADGVFQRGCVRISIVRERG